MKYNIMYQTYSFRSIRPVEAIQVLRKAVEGRGGGNVSNFLEKTHYEDVRFNIISVTRGWVRVKFPGKKRYITLEWPLL